MSFVIYLIIILLGVGTGVLVGYFLFFKKDQTDFESLKKEIEIKQQEAEQKAHALLRAADIDAKDMLLKAKTQAEKEADERRGNLISQEKKLGIKEEQLDKRIEQTIARERDYEQREKVLQQKEQDILKQEKRLEKLGQETESKLQEIAAMSAEEAKRRLMEQLEGEARRQAAVQIKKIEQEADAEAQEKSRKIIAQAIQRYAGEFVSESTVSVVDLPSDDMKGRIIGREGRNIRALENACGIDLIIDDTPEAVVISAFNPIRREIAKMTLERLISDGRIHPARIEEVVEKCKREIDNLAKQAGEQAAFDLGLHGIHQDIIKLLGKLKYRHAGTHNQLQHAIEVGIIAGLIAGEIGYPVKQARRAGLLHDIGKAVEHDIEGSHAHVGAEICKRYGEHASIIKAIRTHEGEEPQDTILSIIVDAANKLSNFRPGARKEQMETYIKRLYQLEEIGKSFHGVEQAFAIQSGREIRLIVAQDKLSDDETVVLCRDITKRIETEMTYAATVKVTVVRESRAVEIAR